MLDSQQPDGTYPSVVPLIWGVGSGRTSWAEAGIIVPWNMYKNVWKQRSFEQQLRFYGKIFGLDATQNLTAIFNNGVIHNMRLVGL